ncbi:MAG: hypothetical protein SGPRY_004039 [Prymnesium sp.]
MPDAAVVKCVNCGWHQPLVQIVPSVHEYYTCELAHCRKYQPVQVVRRRGEVLRSYDVAAIKKQARDMNAEADLRRKSATLSRQKKRAVSDKEIVSL